MEWSTASKTADRSSKSIITVLLFSIANISFNRKENKSTVDLKKEPVIKTESNGRSTYKWTKI